ncbi:UNVERIFIED_CONTAM: hypothetical protein Sindi_2133800 [Sesamum indicum]
MVIDAVRPNYLSFSHDVVPNDGTRSCPVDVGPSSYCFGGSPYDYESGLADRFYNVVHAANHSLWNGCTQSQLVAVAELVDIKVDDHIFEQSYDQISQWANKILPLGHTLLRDYYSTKKLTKNLGLPIEKINACKNGCMLYWKDDADLEYCKFCRDACRLEGETHTTRSPQEPRNVQLGFYTDSFAPHGQYGRTYSCSPVIITSYKFPRGMCTSSEYMFLTMLILGHSNPKRLINVYLELLIEELLQLWHVGVLTYDNAIDNTFIMPAALMWTVKDLPAYGMAYGWSTAGIMGYPIYMDDTRTFHLQHGRKACYFDYHRQFLPEHHPYRRNKKPSRKIMSNLKLHVRGDKRPDKDRPWDMP